MWLNALSIESPQSQPTNVVVDVKESVRIPLDFYPLCEISPVGYRLFPNNRTAVLMDKGIIIGVEHETAIRSNLPFVMFRHAASVSFVVVPGKLIR